VGLPVGADRINVWTMWILFFLVVVGVWRDGGGGGSVVRCGGGVRIDF
jgi:hypothetical protein